MPKMISFTYCLLVFVVLLTIDISKASDGGLISPPPRSYTTLSSRAALVNAHPCGGSAYSTQYPSVSSVYSNFLHQNVLNKDSQYITEGSLLNVSFLPVFYSQNSTYYRFSLCMDTTTYTYTKCILLSELNSNVTQFNLYFSQYDINPSNSGYNYHWTSITDRMSMLEEKVKKHSLYVPNHIFHSLGITDTSLNEGINISATLVFEWVISDYQVIDNCADLLILPDSDDNEDHTSIVDFDDLITPTISDLPGTTTDSDGTTSTNDVCTYNPNGTAYSRLDAATVGQRCGENVATCAPGQCCNNDGVCGPYMSNIYEYYHNDILLESLPIYLSLPNFGAIDAFSAQLSFCESNIVIDNRYIPDSARLKEDGYNPSDFIDLCWKCNLDNPNECTYTNWFVSNDTAAISQTYKFYDSATASDNSDNNGGSSSSSNNSMIGDLIVVVIFLIIFCCIFAWLYRAYKFNRTKRRPTKMRLLDVEPGDMVKGRDVSNSAIDAAGGSIHEHDDITSFGQHGYSDDSDIDNNDKDPLDINDDLEDDDNKVGGILGRASLDATSAAETPLPTGWEEFRTDNGERYYHNGDTDVTTWDRPE